MLRNTLAAAVAAAAICSLTLSDNLTAATKAPVVTFTASGTFASPQTSGVDTLKLAGETFSVTIAVGTATAPFKHGSNWAAYNQLKLTGVVHSGLLGSTPVNISSAEASIIQAIDPGKYDIFTMEAPIRVVGIGLVIKAIVVMPFGTIPKTLLHPFAAPVAMTPTNATVTYADAGNSTVLAVAKGVLTATIPAVASSNQQ
jgi:hypothetical protein